MRKYKFKSSVVIIISVLVSCKSEVQLKSIDPVYQILFSPFSTKHIAIFNCENKTDTIIFYPVEERLNKIRHFERGFYNEYIKIVEYELTPGSYHQFPQNPKAIFLSLTNRTDNDRTQVRLNFLGLIFDEDGLYSLIQNGVTMLSDSHARYKFININDCIKSVQLDQQKGVIEFTDCDGQKWNRK